MERNSTEIMAPDSRDETLVSISELTLVEYFQHLSGPVAQYVRQHPKSTNTQLFSFLALLNAYTPDSYLLMPECQKILGPPDPIHGGPPFEERMEPFTVLIRTSSSSSGHMIHPLVAKRAVELLAELRISRSATMKKFMFSLCGDQPQPYILQFIKDLLTKRKSGERGREKFSRLIEDIGKKENFYNAVSVLKTASDKLTQNPIFPQIISRLFYIRKEITDYKKAEGWAKKAIRRAPNNSYVADTLGQIYKNRLMRKAKQLKEISNVAKDAFDAFKDVEMKAEREEDPGMEDIARTVSLSNFFNIRGLFGFMQVAKIAFEKLSQENSSFTQNLVKEEEVIDKFVFFEWYLTYSKPDMTSSEPPYFWRDVVLCYEHYTTATAAESTSFTGLLDCLNHGLFMSKGRRARFVEAEKTVSDLEAIRDDLKTIYETTDDVKAAERYILSNIILSNKMHNSPRLTPVRELQTIIHRFLDTEEGHRSPAFYLLVLLLFWPEVEPQVVQEEDDEEVELPSTEDDESNDQIWEDEDNDEEQEPRGEPAQPSLELTFDRDLQQYVTLMKTAYDRSKYAKYLRGRYLLPLFFLGKGSGLSKWIHKSRLDAIVEEKVDSELCVAMKEKRIDEMWIKGEVWGIPEIQDILLPVQGELCHSPTMPQGREEQDLILCAGGKKIMAVAEIEPDASALSPMLFYLGFTIQGPVIFKVGFPHMFGQ